MWLKLIIVFVIPFSIMISLGTWQIFRLKEKTNIIHAMQVPSTKLSVHDLVKQNCKNIEVNGTFDNDYRFFVFAGTLGYYVLQPFHLNDGRYILVNKGTVLDKTSKLEINNTTQQNIQGILYCDSNKKVGWFVKNDVNANVWFWFDIENMMKHINIPLESCIIWAGNAVVFDGITANVPLKVRNDHLEYVITWYLSALIWLVGYIYLCRYK
ncbi:SURF1 family protein [Ehrlichia chaffeensis]|uniref:SURF1 family protein n=1 Tax=Ehrlichia chaffeensis TaxID=945 RepID=UPI000303AF32|nr:SURF1 family protein [Ehrlichia chaffeensis]